MATIEETQHYQRISWLSKWLQWLFGFFIVAMTTFLVSIVSMAFFADSFLDKGLITLANDWLTTSQVSLKELVETERLLLLGIFASKTTFAILINLYIFSRFYLLFKNFRALNVFTGGNVKLLRQAAIALFVDAVAKLLMMPMLIYAFVWTQNTLDDIAIKHNLYSGDGYVENFFTISAIFLASWLLAIGREMNIDRQLTV